MSTILKTYILKPVSQISFWSIAIDACARNKRRTCNVLTELVKVIVFDRERIPKTPKLVKLFVLIYHFLSIRDVASTREMLVVIRVKKLSFGSGHVRKVQSCKLILESRSSPRSKICQDA